MLSDLKILLGFLLFLSLSANKCSEAEKETSDEPALHIEPVVATEPAVFQSAEMVMGAERFDLYLPKLQSLNIALVVNQTSIVGDQHLVDALLARGVQVKKIFSPEHGFRGKADAGETVADGRDAQTGIPILSIYGSKKKPASEDLAGIDLVLFDVQDVGARFYTYIYTMSYVMEACAENGVRFLVLDRPNPNGHYVGGPMLKKGFESFVGLHPIPVVHGMTVGEYARMVNDEGWLKNGVRCQLEVIPCDRYNHRSFYELPVKPSPNLPNMQSIYLYPSICYFEGTVASLGRGTSKQFQVLGHPDYPDGDFYFTPMPNEGAKSPKLQGQRCRGYDYSTTALTTLQDQQFDLSYLINFYQQFPDKASFWRSDNFIRLLWGSEDIKQWLAEGRTAAEITATWQEDLAAFKAKRQRYLLYEDFE
ncbi:MAG: DUF1343 domain-containing protein [Bacteroidota bacterium]